MNFFSWRLIANGIDVLELKRQYPCLEINHRSEKQNFMRTIHLFRESQKLVSMAAYSYGIFGNISFVY
ncbi:MAG: hypothetical protein QNJ55_13980 [Xenococcus sp. MO_188.B8]|nr:hypothetical protein [Xenococcus sp. MO_188.B8]